MLTSPTPPLQDQQFVSPRSLSLRPGIILHRHAGATRGGVLEDPHSRRFYRLGQTEYWFVEQLLGNSHVESAWRATNRKLYQAETKASSLKGSISTTPCPTRCEPISHIAVEQLCKWLIDTGLVTGEEGASPAPAGSNHAPERSVWSQLYFAKWPLLNPDRAVTAFTRRMGWLFAWQINLLGLLMGLIAIILTSGNWQAFFASYDNLFTSWRPMWLFVVWLMLKFVHELAHAATCKRYGGDVPEAGIATILFMPLGYVDVTSSWRFASNWQRLHVTLAGVAWELTIAGLALLAWNYLEALPLRQAAADLVLLASVSSLLFNLNPLLKFDGYYALADITRIDNLYSQGRAYAQYWGARYLLGLGWPSPTLSPNSEWWIKLYGLSAAVWRCLSITTLLLAAAALLHGAGIILAVVGVYIYYVQPAARFVMHLHELWTARELYVARLIARLCLLGLVLLGPVLLFPMELAMTAPGIIEYDPPCVLRAPCDGFVEEIFVGDGELVAQGQPIARLRNEQLDIELSGLRRDLARVEQLARSARWRGNSSELKEVQSESASIVEQLVELEHQLGASLMEAPVAGRITARRLADLQGTYVRRGDEIVAIGQEHSKRAKVSLTQWEAAQHRDWGSQPVLLSVQGLAVQRVHLSHLESRASDQPAHLALTVVGGGRLAVLKRDDSHVLCEPRINGYITLSESYSREVRCGQRCYVRLDCWRQSLGYWLWSKLLQNDSWHFLT